MNPADLPPELGRPAEALLASVRAIAQGPLPRRPRITDCP